MKRRLDANYYMNLISFVYYQSCGACCCGLEHRSYGKLGKLQHFQQSWRSQVLQLECANPNKELGIYIVTNENYWRYGFKRNLFSAIFYTCYFAWNGHAQALHSGREKYILCLMGEGIIWVPKRLSHKNKNIVIL